MAKSKLEQLIVAGSVMSTMGLPVVWEREYSVAMYSLYSLFDGSISTRPKTLVSVVQPLTIA